VVCRDLDKVECKALLLNATIDFREDVGRVRRSKCVEFWLPKDMSRSAVIEESCQIVFHVVQSGCWEELCVVHRHMGLVRNPIVIVKIIMEVVTARGMDSGEVVPLKWAERVCFESLGALSTQDELIGAFDVNLDLPRRGTSTSCFACFWHRNGAYRDSSGTGRWQELGVVTCRRSGGSECGGWHPRLPWCCADVFERFATYPENRMAVSPPTGFHWRLRSVSVG
jgi:hypothetical protein